MATNSHSAGDIIESQCTKCRTLTNHTIVAMVGNVPVKVQCNTCGGQHKYRPQSQPKAPAAKRIQTASKPRQNEWQKLKEETAQRAAINYSMTTSFKVGDIMNHPTFGTGFVRTCISPGKIEVLFEDGLKKLRCN